MSEVEFHLFALIKQLEIKKGEKITVAEVAKKAKLHRNTVQRISDNETERVDLTTLAKLRNYFRSEGMPIDIGDLFTDKVA
jgi:transcriptional regulator with XRE-family HTH domain